MSKPYLCTPCNYTTLIKKSYEIHCKTMKHTRNLKESLKQICPYCKNIFTLKKCLDAHLKVCSLRDEIDFAKNDKDEQIEYLKTMCEERVKQYEKLLKKITKEKNELIKSHKIEKEELIKQYTTFKNDCIKIKDEEINLLKEEVAQLHNLVKQGGNIVKTSIGAIKYAIKNFSNAPALATFSNYELFIAQNKNSIVDIILFNFKNDLLHKYIGDIIIKAYKRDNCEEQSLWNTDTSRLSYIIKGLIDKNDPLKCEWKVDKNAIFVKEFIITPILLHIKKILLENASIMKKHYQENEFEYDSYQTSLYDETLKGISYLTHQLESFPHLEQNILKHISPHFFLKNKLIEN